MNLTRRKLLHYGLGCGLGLLSAGAEWSIFPSNRHLVLINLKGGNDGFNTLVPYANSNYYQARPTLAVPPEAVLKLSESFGLHPNLSGLHEIYRERKLAVIANVSYPNASRSHARAAQILADFLPEGEFADNLNEVAQKLRHPRPALVHQIDLCGFDTHRNQKERHEALLSELDTSITSFIREFERTDKDVLLLVFSEFGRSFAENEQGGTDHGTVQPLFILGRAVQGGIWDDRSVTDFRRVYATISERFLMPLSATRRDYRFKKIDFIV